jgi:hypothetical protein
LSSRALFDDRRRGTLKANRRRRPILESLEGRVLLSMVDLTLANSSGTINGADYRQGLVQPAGSGNIQSFVRLGRTGTEQGYNTDARGGPGSSYADSAQMGTDTTASFDHSLPLNQVPIITVNGQAVLDFVLDINQQNSSPFLSLDEIQLSVSTSNTLGSTGPPSSNYYTADGTYGGNATLVYDQNPGGGRSNWVALNAGPSSGAGGADMFLDVPLSDLPASAFSSGFQGQLPLNPNDYIYLFSAFGGQGTNGPGNNAHPTGPVDYTTNGGFEQWATPTLGSTQSSVSTTILDASNNPVTSVPAFSTVHDSATVTGSAGIPTGNVTFLFYSTIGWYRPRCRCRHRDSGCERRGEPVRRRRSTDTWFLFVHGPLQRRHHIPPVGQPRRAADCRESRAPHPPDHDRQRSGQFGGQRAGGTGHFGL